MAYIRSHHRRNHSTPLAGRLAIGVGGGVAHGESLLPATFYQELIRKVESLPGVESASSGTIQPLSRVAVNFGNKCKTQCDVTIRARFYLDFRPVPRMQPPGIAPAISI